MANIYHDIATRTNGDIYIGVVGPVRTGKSTFIKRFMETAVLPNIADAAAKQRAIDELPQSGAGKTIMTTEPKFVPNEPAAVTLSDGTHFSVKMVDCVGYIVDSALGTLEDGTARMVSTPWFADPVPFDTAAEIGTKKVITDHSTIGVVVTTDGTICDLERRDYEQAEARVVEELKKTNKPFVIVVNSKTPTDVGTAGLTRRLEEKYGVPAISLDASNMGEEEILAVLRLVLFQFPVCEIGITLPGWVSALENDHWLKKTVYENVREYALSVHHIGELSEAPDRLADTQYVKSAHLDEVDMGCGKARIHLEVEDGLFYTVIGEKTGLDISDDKALIQMIDDLSSAKREYDKIKGALEQVYTSGYGIMMPAMSEIALEKPEIIKQGGKFGVKIKATAPSIHLIRADIEADVSPIVGTQAQSENLVNYLCSEGQDDPAKIWDFNIFGKSLKDLVNDGLAEKLTHIPQDSRDKLQKALGRVVNEGSGGLFIIIF